MIDVCILWGWCLHVFWTMPCHLYRGVCHVFLWSLWWLAQACKLGIVMLLICPCSAVILMPCKLDATKRSMHILRYFGKDVLDIWLSSIHSCPCLQLRSSLACHFRAPLLFLKRSTPRTYSRSSICKNAKVWAHPCLLVDILTWPKMVNPLIKSLPLYDWFILISMCLSSRYYAKCVHVCTISSAPQRMSS